MKKLLNITALTLALALSMSLNSLAASVNTSGGKQDIDVNAKYVDGVDTPTVYKVDVSWGAMEFTYSVNGTKNWDPDNHQYTINTNGGWAASGNKITVTNHSNTGIKADFAYEKERGFDDITGSFSQSSLTLPTAEGKATDDAALTGESELTISGTLASDKTSMTKVGKVVVTISKA